MIEKIIKELFIEGSKTPKPIPLMNKPNRMEGRKSRQNTATMERYKLKGEHFKHQPASKATNQLKAEKRKRKSNDTNEIVNTSEK